MIAVAHEMLSSPHGSPIVSTNGGVRTGNRAEKAVVGWCHLTHKFIAWARSIDTGPAFVF